MSYDDDKTQGHQHIKCPADIATVSSGGSLGLSCQ